MLERLKQLLAVPRNEVAQALLRPVPIAEDNRTLSVIIRCHKLERLPLLDEALFSLAVQEWPLIEPVIVLQNGSEAFKQSVAELIARQPWLQPPAGQILPVKVPSRVDGRSAVLTAGIERARGRYLAFLDDDDYVYQHCYKLLIEQLAQSECAVAVGGTRAATMTLEAGGWYVAAKATPYAWGRDKFDLLRNNFIPIHSYVIDRARVSAEDLRFDNDLPPLEDYEFLLRLAAKYDFDFTHLSTPVCEYRWHADNSVPHDPAATPPSVLRALRKIYERKQKTYLAVSIAQWVELRQILTSCQIEIVYVPQPEPKRLLHKLADRFYSAIDQSPGFAKNLGRLSRNVKKALGLYRPENG